MSDETRFVVPPQLQAGTYANMLETWHTEHELTLDFGVLRRDEQNVERIADLVARVHIPATIAFDVVRSINNEFTEYERKYGDVRRPCDAPEKT